MSETDDQQNERMSRLDAVAHYFADERSGSLYDKVYRALRRAILAGDVQPGDKIAEMDLTSLLPVSRTPIREAFRRLEAEKLVAPSPSRGIVVQGVTLSDLADIFQVLESVETLAARLAATRISKDELSQLKRSLDLLIFFVEQERWEEMTAQGVAFHNIIYGASGNPRLCILIRSLREHVHSFRRFHLRTLTLASRGVEEHIAIYEALAARDDDGAAAITCQHVQQSRRILEKLIESTGETPDNRLASRQDAVPASHRATGQH